MLQLEVSQYKLLYGVAGVPKMIWADHDQDHLFAFVIEHIEKSLDEYFEKKNEFSFEEVLAISQKMIKIIDNIHSKGVVHGQISSRSIMIDPENNNLFLLDYENSVQSSESPSVKN